VRGEPSVGESMDESVAVVEKPLGPVTSRSLLSIVAAEMPVGLGPDVPVA
jgi:hypothetical protein